jgi:hypothetical protein
MTPAPGGDAGSNGSRLLGMPVPSCDFCGKENESIRVGLLTGKIPASLHAQLLALTDPTIFRSPYACPDCRRNLRLLMAGGMIMASEDGSMEKAKQISMGVATVPELGKPHLTVEPQSGG